MTMNSEVFDELPVADRMRAGLRRLGKAVVVITTMHEGQRMAMTATAVSELSLEPPSLLVCVNRSASLYHPLTDQNNFAVNILHADQIDVCNSCFGKTKGEERFQVGHWDSAACGTPLLRDAQASFVCEYETRMEFGTHAIIVGCVQEVRISRDVDPLIYLDGGFARACPLESPDGA